MRTVCVFAMLASLSGCTTPRTQVMLRFDADPSIARDSSSIRLTVTGEPGGSRWAQSQITAPSAWPYEAGVVPAGGDASRTFVAVAEALDVDGTILGTVSIETGFVAGRTLLASLRFEEACRGSVCPALQTCVGGECVPRGRAASALPAYSPPASDGGLDTPPDAGDGTDVGVDGGELPLLLNVSAIELTGCNEPSSLAAIGPGRFVIACAGSDRLATLTVTEEFSLALGEAEDFAGEAPAFVAVANVEGDAMPEVVVTLPGRVSVRSSVGLDDLGGAVFPSGTVVQPTLAVRSGSEFDDVVMSSSRGLRVLGGAVDGTVLLGALPIASNGAVSIALAPWGSGEPGLLVVGGETPLRVGIHGGASPEPGLAALSAAPIYEDVGAARGQYIRVVDLNGDPLPDVVVLHGYDRGTPGAGFIDALLAADVGGSFTLTRSDRRATGPGPVSSTACHIDDDDFADIIVPHIGLVGAYHPLVVFFSDGAGGFGSPLTIELDEPVRAVECDDIDDDGHVDLVVVHGAAGAVGHATAYRNLTP